MVPLIPLLLLPVVDWLLLGEVDEPDCDAPDCEESGLDCCATAIPIEKRAAVATARSFFDIHFSCRKWQRIG